MQAYDLQGVLETILLHLLEVKIGEWLLGVWLSKHSMQSCP